MCAADSGRFRIVTDHNQPEGNLNRRQPDSAACVDDVACQIATAHVSFGFAQTRN